MFDADSFVVRNTILSMHFVYSRPPNRTIRVRVLVVRSVTHKWIPTDAFGWPTRITYETNDVAVPCTGTSTFEKLENILVKSFGCLIISSTPLRPETMRRLLQRPHLENKEAFKEVFECLFGKIFSFVTRVDDDDEKYIVELLRCVTKSLLRIPQKNFYHLTSVEWINVKLPFHSIPFCFKLQSRLDSTNFHSTY